MKAHVRGRVCATALHSLLDALHDIIHAECCRCWRWAHGLHLPAAAGWCGWRLLSNRSTVTCGSAACHFQHPLNHALGHACFARLPPAECKRTHTQARTTRRGGRSQRKAPPGRRHAVGEGAEKQGADAQLEGKPHVLIRIRSIPRHGLRDRLRDSARIHAVQPSSSSQAAAAKAPDSTRPSAVCTTAPAKSELPREPPEPKPKVLTFRSHACRYGCCRT